MQCVLCGEFLDGWVGGWVRGAWLTRVLTLGWRVRQKIVLAEEH